MMMMMMKITITAINAAPPPVSNRVSNSECTISDSPAAPAMIGNINPGSSDGPNKKVFYSKRLYRKVKTKIHLSPDHNQTTDEKLPLVSTSLYLYLLDLLLYQVMDSCLLLV